MEEMNKKSEYISKEVMRHAQEIKALLEANGGMQYLSIALFENGTIMFFNGHNIENCDCKGLVIDGYQQGEINGND